jgi:Tol biopolymer transport system component
MLGFVPRAILAALLVTFICAVPSSARVGNGKIAFVAEDGLYTVNPDGTGRTRLKAENHLLSARWSPDGSRLAFIDVHGSLDWRLMVMDADGSNEHVVAFARNLALSRQPWSPDSARIAWKAQDPYTGGDVYTANASGGDVRRLTFSGSVGSPAWSPTGSTLAYTRRRIVFPQGEPLFVIGADGSGERQITEPGTYIEDPTWSPTGEWIAFSGVGMVRPDGSNLHWVTPGLGGRSPSWSPDGSKIAFGVSSFYRGSGRADVYVVDADGSHLKRLNWTPDTKLAWAPVWSPDGVRVLFQSGTLVTVNSDGSCPIRLAPGGRDAGDLSSWQPIPNGPPAGPERCHAISVTTRVARARAAARIEATVVNEGTDPLTKVTLEVPAHDAVSPAGYSPGCTVRRGKLTCRLRRLEPGDSHDFSFRLEARRVRPSGGIIRRPARISVDASEELFLSGRERTNVTLAIVRCRVGDRGGGIIRGTSSDDWICGRTGVDRIYPGPGNDEVKAGGGNDVIVAVDGRRHRDRISCGPGRDRVSADRHDRIADDCERVTRH